LKYKKVKEAIFEKRPNRFLAHVQIDGKMEVVHVKNTGRLREILKEGCKVYLEESDNTNRKTKYSLIAAYKEKELINLDSQIPNYVVYEGIQEGKVIELTDTTFLAREKIYGNSRFDLYFEREEKKGFIEVKGVTLEENGVAKFPDAPTTRGSKHIYEMIQAVEEGYEGYIFFLIQMKGVKTFTPNDAKDAEFAKALRTAKSKGVHILAYDSIVSSDGIVIDSPIEVNLD
jgi:sugar fermentation stimulation protein A